MLVHPALPAGGDANHSAPLNLDADGNLLVNVAEGTISVSSGAQYNSTPPTMTPGSTGPLQCDQNGKLYVSGSITATSAATAQSSPQTFTAGTSNPLQADLHGSEYVSLRDATGAAQGSLSNPLRVDPVGTTTQPVSGTVAVSSLPALPAGSNAIGSVSVTGTPAVSPAAATSGGASPFHLISAATTNATSVKASAGVLYSVDGFNINASSPRYVKLYDKATAPTPGTDTPVHVFLIPANGAGFVKAFPTGLQFLNGIAFAITAGIADTDATAVAAAECALNLGYK